MGSDASLLVNHGPGLMESVMVVGGAVFFGVSLFRFEWIEEARGIRYLLRRLGPRAAKELCALAGALVAGSGLLLLLKV